MPSALAAWIAHKTIELTSLRRCTKEGCNDEQITDRLTQALARLDIGMLGHLVIGGRQHTSLAERGI